jgi:hypothetical protein
MKQNKRTQLKNHIAELSQLANKQLTIKDMKRLYELENKLHKLAEDYCNGVIRSGEEYETRQLPFKTLLKELLPIPHLFVNNDPRGYALKIEDEYIRESNSSLYRDMGGYGIVCPEELEGAV